MQESKRNQDDSVNLADHLEEALVSFSFAHLALQNPESQTFYFPAPLAIGPSFRVAR